MFSESSRQHCVSTGAVAALVAVLLREHGAPEGMGPVHSIGIGPASVMSYDLAERCDPFVTSLCLRSAEPDSSNHAHCVDCVRSAKAPALGLQSNNGGVKQLHSVLPVMLLCSNSC